MNRIACRLCLAQAFRRRLIAAAFGFCLLNTAPIQGQQTPAPAPPIEPVKTSITVTDTISTDAPAAITVLDSAGLQAAPGIELDDRLRLVPGFTLFRRTSSVVANPTTQGISLRGIGSSGASRTLLLWDGIPENDPFGGWVYWDRFAPLELERVEISRGASTSVFGDLAMGGVISVFSRTATKHHFEAAYDGGNDRTNEVYAGASEVFGKFAVSANTRLFTTEGYFIVPSYLRGLADTRAGVDFATGDLRLDYFGTNDKVFLRFDALAEHRANGTRLTTNSTGLGSLSGNYTHQWTHDQISVLGYRTQEGFHSSFSSVTSARNVENITFTQSVPSQAEGGAVLYRHDAHRWDLLAGADVSNVKGVDTDHLRPTGVRVGGGSILQHGVFGQVDFSAGPFKFFGGIRQQFTGQGGTFVSPNGGIVVGQHRWRARGSVYRSFRAPTLNELYRTFQVGNTLTESNAALVPETLFGAEAGFDFIGETTHASVTFYRNQLHNLITNVTLQSSKTLIVRQRQNAADALSRGIEASLHHSWGHLSGDLSYLLADSRFVTGLRISQVPRNQGTGTLSYTRKNTLASAGVRVYSLQFDDDLNQFILPGFTTVGMTVQQAITPTLSLRGSVDNVLDRQYLVALTPTPNTGSPRLYRFGVRYQFK